MGAIYKREMQSYFYTPAAYVFMGVFLALASVFFGVGNLAARSSNLLSFISQGEKQMVGASFHLLYYRTNGFSHRDSGSAMVCQRTHTIEQWL